MKKQYELYRTKVEVKFGTYEWCLLDRFTSLAEELDYEYQHDAINLGTVKELHDAVTDLSKEMIYICYTDYDYPVETSDEMLEPAPIYWCKKGSNYEVEFETLEEAFIDDENDEYESRCIEKSKVDIKSLLDTVWSYRCVIEAIHVVLNTITTL